MGWHTWRYVARGHNKEAYRLCQCCQKIEREDFILTDYTSATTAEKEEVTTTIASEKTLITKPRFHITAWKIKGRNHVVFGENGPKSLADWQLSISFGRISS
jgi:hypothetical protein